MKIDDKIVIKLPCGKKGKVHRGAYELMGDFEYCHDSCKELQKCKFMNKG